mgnify:CR=1 FL=1
MGAISLKKLSLGAAAAALALGAALPAEAGGRHHGRGHGYHGHHWGHGHYKPRRHYYYGHHGHHRGGLSGGEAAVIAAAIIGGAILIDSANDRASYNNRYDDRYYGARYPAPSRYSAPPRYSSGPADDYYYRRDDSGYASQGQPYGDDYGLDGAGPVAIFSYNYGAAYNDCKAETRAAADQGGLFVALPAKPQQITPIDDGAAVRFTADFIANDRRGIEVRKTMVCEADLEGVRFLELV